MTSKKKYGSKVSARTQKVLKSNDRKAWEEEVLLLRDEGYDWKLITYILDSYWEDKAEEAFGVFDTDKKKKK